MAWKSLLLALVSLAVIGGFPSTPMAYDVFPGKVAATVGKYALHEQLALASQECADSEDPDDRLRCIWPELERYITNKLPKLSNADWALVRGVQWPDNPVRTATSAGVLGFAVQMARKCATRQHSTGGIVCKSHYHDLQFMHAMSPSLRQSADETQTQILEWLHFVYAAAMEPGVLDATLAESTSADAYAHIRAAIAPPVDRDVAMSEWQGWSLFSYLSSRKIATSRHPDLRDFPVEFLVGVMLHAVQDSFAAGHNLRGNTESTTPRVTCESILEFYTYPGQDDNMHAACDKIPVVDQSCARQDREVDDPVTAGARVLRMAKRRAPWSEVESRTPDMA